MKQKLLHIFLACTLCTINTIQSMSLGSVRNLRDSKFRPLLEQPVSNETIAQACNLINTPGLQSYADYNDDFYRPFVETFGASPNKMSGLINAIGTVQTAINQALPTKGGAATLPAEQTALKAVQDFLAKGGSPYLFLNDVNAIIASLTSSGGGSGTGGSAATDPNVIAVATNLQPLYTQQLITNNMVNLPTLMQCSADLTTFLKTISAQSTPSAALGNWAQQLVNTLKNTGQSASAATSTATDPNVIQIGKIVLQPNDTYFDNNANPTKIVDINQLITKLQMINNPSDTLVNLQTDDFSNLSAFGLIDSALQVYMYVDDGSYRFNNEIDPINWGINVAGAISDANRAYDQLKQIQIDGFTISSSDYLTDIISQLIDLVGTGSGTGTAGNMLTDPNIITIATALSGINHINGIPESYVTYDATTKKTSINPTKINAMATFATKLRAALDSWNGGDDPLTAADPALRFDQVDFDTYVAAMNGAVADETDLLEQVADTYDENGNLYGAGGLITQINSYLGTSMVWSTTKLPSYNIFGEADQDGNTVVNPKGVFAAMIELSSGTKAGTNQNYTLDNTQSIAALAQTLADQIYNHNMMISNIASSSGIVSKAFTESPTTSSNITFSNGRSYSVSGNPGTSTTRTLTQETFYQIVNKGPNGLITTLNNQASILFRQVKALQTAGATNSQFITSTNSTPITYVSSFATSSNIALPTTSTAGQCFVQIMQTTF